MTTEYSISIDWYDELKNNPDKWINHGRNILEDSCEHKTQDTDTNEENRETNIRYSGYCEECEIGEDDFEPMMNYGYPLHHEPSKEEILKIVKNTCLTIMENTETGDFFLVLCGGGMDLSQNIALAYSYCGYIPNALAFNVSTQYGLNFTGETYFSLMSEIKDSLNNTIKSYERKIKEIEEAVKKAKETKK